MTGHWPGSHGAAAETGQDEPDQIPGRLHGIQVLDRRLPERHGRSRQKQIPPGNTDDQLGF